MTARAPPEQDQGKASMRTSAQSITAPSAVNTEAASIAHALAIPGRLERLPLTGYQPMHCCHHRHRLAIRQHGSRRADLRTWLDPPHFPAQLRASRYLLDFVGSRPTNPAPIPGRIDAAWY